MGYHRAKINKGVLGELSKVQEELDEAKDAENQSNKVLLICELADIIGAVRLYLKKNFGKEITLGDLNKMAKATRRAFKHGER